MLRADSIGFSYDGRQNALAGISFELPPGHHLAVMGASGSGKSTLLRILYGSLAPDRGTLWHNQKQLQGPEGRLLPGHPGFQYVTQAFDLNPYTRVADFLRMNLNPHEANSELRRIRDLLELVQLPGVEQSEIRHLSLGQQQRIALVRALLGKPRILLLDEPFTHVDADQKNYLRLRLFPYLKDLGVTVVNATHDGQDVLPFADSTLVLKQGRTIALGPTSQLYGHPRTRYIASLLGLVNEIRGADFDLGQAADPILIYAEEVRITAHGSPPDPTCYTTPVTVRRCFFQGSRYLLELKTSPGHLLYAFTPEAQPEGNPMVAAIPRELVHLRMSY